VNLGDSAAYGAPSLSRRRFYGMDPFKAQRLNKSLKFFLTWKLPFLMPRGMVLNFKKSICCVRHELLDDPVARTETSKIDFFAVNYPPITTVSTSARWKRPPVSRHPKYSHWIIQMVVDQRGEYPSIHVTRTICCGFLREHPALWGWVKTLVPFVHPKS